MTISRLLKDLRKRHIRLWLDGDRLRYHAATGAMTEGLRARIREHRSKLIDILRQQTRCEAEAPLVPIPRSDELPLSFGQQRIWAIHKLSPDGLAYNVPATMRLAGKLDRSVLRRALDEIVARHETMRSTFPTVDGKPRLVIADHASFDLREDDLRSLSRETRLEHALHRARADAGGVFDLERGPLVRGVLFRLDDEDQVLHVCMHHIVTDGWSMGVLFQELSALYAAFLAGAPSPLPDLPIQYADYAQWQERRLGGAQIENDLAYWRMLLGDLPPTLCLPTDRPRPPVQSYRGDEVSHVVPDAVFASLTRISRNQGATMFMTMLAAFCIVLWRHSGQSDLVVGTPIAGRARKEVEDLIGFFVNNLVLRIDHSGNPSFTEFLARVRRVVLDAFARPEVPFDKLVEELRPKRELGRNPLFQVLFNHFDMTVKYDDKMIGPLELRPTGTPLPISKFDMTLHCFQDRERLVVKFEYATDLFDRGTIERVCRHYLNLLRDIASDPRRAISMLSLSDEAERERVIFKWNRTDQDSSQHPCVHRTFEENCRTRPDAPAVVFEDQRLSYLQLNRLASRVAYRLRSLGVGVDDRVALYFERSLEMVVALMGVLKSGGSYVPLDPTYPVDRLAFMLADSAPKVLLTQSFLAGHLPRHDARVLCLDREEDLPPDDRNDRLPAVDMRQLAYVMYTSGSTGRPKGVAVEHGQLLNYVLGLLQCLDLPTGTSFATVSTLAADLGNTSIFGALCSGGCLHVMSEARVFSGDAFADYMHSNGVDCVKIVPSHLGALLGSARHPARVLPRRLLVLGGEASTWELVERVRSLAPSCEIVNHYGPTESTVGVLTFRCRAGDSDKYPFGPPIGRPIANTQVYLLDHNGEPAPLGAVGELHVGGRSVARGYLNLPEKTGERFAPDPFHSSGGRIYGTGDLARYASDGNVIFLGRSDDQVKVRGHRIELGEIETVLQQHEAVELAAALVRQDQRRDPLLVAYVVPREAASLSTADVLSYVKTRLPAYMVPSVVTLLDSMPLTPNGKVDRDLLPAPSRVPQSGEAYVALHSQLEAKIASIWCEVLEVEQVGAQHNFFELGGHSLRLIEVHAKIVERLGHDVSITDLFQYPTVRALARRLGDSCAQDRPLRQAAAVRIGRRREDAHGPIAVIGMAGRFPGAPDLETFWQNLRAGVESLREFKDEELREAGIPDAIIGEPNYVKRRPVLEGVDQFDAWYFGYTSREAELIDPQQRVFLECAVEALERTGYDPDRYEGLIGVYAGACLNTYLMFLQSDPARMRGASGLETVISSDKDFLPTRVSYKLNLRGPSVNVQTACSTSLVAVHEACRSLLDHQCDIALAGGVSASLPVVRGYLFEEGGPASPDGHCRPFDARASGTIEGNGVGIVVLKRLQESLRDGDQVHALILGTAINNDGSNKVGYTAPSVDGQAAVIAMAQATAGVQPETISYIEAHGTGTSLGDPIEVAALTKVFREQTDRAGFCGLGSLKSNVGHMRAAAGVGGVIKTVLALEHKELPPSVNFDSPNPEIDFRRTPFYVNAKLREWESDGHPRRAGVSSFGIGGTNAHILVEEAPALEASDPPRGEQLLVLSAKTNRALAEAGTALASHLRSHPSVNLADVAYTLQVGRRVLEHRLAVRCSDLEDAVAALRGERPEAVYTCKATTTSRPVVFMFPGQGSQDVNVGLELYQEHGSFREAVDACLEIVDGELGLGLGGALYPDGADTEASRERIKRTSLAQPALFVVSYALTQLFEEWGIVPESMIGHSVGEYVAACLSGVLTLEEAVRLIVIRGRLMEAMPPGVMTAVPLGEEEVSAALSLEEGLWLSAVNAPSICVVSGVPDRVEAFEERLSGSGVECRRLHTSHAFHSGLMQGAVDPFSEAVRGLPVGEPRIPYVSNVTGNWTTMADVQDPAYWGRHIRNTVRFREGMERVLSDENRVLLEVGPGQVLAALSRQQERHGVDRVVVSSLGRSGAAESATSSVTAALGCLWAGGVDVDWPRVHGGARRRRVTLPTYPFQRERYCVELRRASNIRQDAVSSGNAHSRLDAMVPGSQATEEGASHDEASTLELHPRPELLTEYVAPSTSAEHAISQIWQQVLGVGPIGVHDDFFELGGHSLLATQLTSRIRTTLNVTLPLRDLFDGPTVKELARRIQSTGRLAARPSLVRRDHSDHDGDLPLSFAQQRLWLLDQMGAGAAYNMPMAIRLRGRLDLDGLEKALHELIRRHEALRTSFPVVDETPVQRIAESPEIRLDRIDLGERRGEDQNTAVRRIAIEEAERPFDLSECPLLRSVLLRLGEEEHVLHLTLHHIISDGWSMGVLLHELAVLYEAFSRGGTSPLAEIEIQYGDFTLWQRSWLAGDALEEQLSYWRRQLVDIPTLDLPTDRLRPAEQTFGGASHEFEIAPDLLEALYRLCRREGFTLAMVLLAGWQLLLSRYTGQEDIAVGSPIANRTHDALEPLIGFFVNTLVMRTDLSGDPSIEELLRRVQKVCLSAYEHQDVPFAQVVDAVNPHRDPSINPLFQVSFVLQNVPRAALRPTDLEIDRLSFPATRTRFDLDLHFFEHADRLCGWLIYRSDLFDASTVERMASHLVRVLEGMTSDPSRRVSELSLLSDEERHRALVEWNDTALAYRDNRCVHELFEEQAERTPNDVAVIFGQHTLTYEELNQRANQLAHELRGMGVDAEVLVGVCVERSLELAVALLAVLKAGGAYVPLDPTYPPPRIEQMLQDSEPRVAVVQSDLAGLVPDGMLKTVRVDSEFAAIEGEKRCNPRTRVDPDNLAYVIYTSGSTGRPKGVLGTHRGIVNRCEWMWNAYPFESDEVCCQKTALSFVDSVWEIFGPLLKGIPSVIIPDDHVRDPELLAELLAVHRVTRIVLVPTLLRAMLERLGDVGTRLPDLRLWVSSGETLPTELCEQLHASSPGATLLNLYGSSEVAADATAFDTRRLVQSVDRVPLGRPIANTRCYVLDPTLRPVPVGLPGELYIAGAGMARGYHRRTDLTAEHFIPDPIGGVAGARLYRTGDRARYRPNGVIEFLGRQDYQVKVRGHRIELGEIEAVLENHAAVDQAVAIVREDRPGDCRLVAYVVPTSITTPDQEQALLEQWTSLWGDTYEGSSGEGGEATFNITGWNSSYTGEPLPVGEMREWVDRTVDRILARKPRRVLEIGCGTGLVLFRVAPHCAAYTGTDFSALALDYVQQHLDQVPGLPPKVVLRRQPADEFAGLEAQSYDLVVLNSIVQYFPSVDYLVEVLEGAVRTVSGGGMVFVGDVRNLTLLKAHHASVRLHQSGDETETELLRRKVQEALAQEEELVVDPAFFTALGDHLDRVTHVEVMPKRGESVNELTKFRYDVCLHVGTTSTTTVVKDPPWQDWDGLTEAKLRSDLIEEHPGVVALRGVPNARTVRDARVAELIETGDLRSAGDVRKATRACSGVDPESIWRLGKALGFGVHVSWSRTGIDGRFDVLMVRGGTGSLPSPRLRATGWAGYGSSPVRAMMARQLVPGLRKHLAAALPAYMVPSSLVTVDTLPLTPSGKVNRSALPKPDSSVEAGSFVAPRTEKERLVARIWCEVLGMDRVGLHDNFFNLGGNSLLATQCLTRLQNEFGLRLGVADLMLNHLGQLVARCESKRCTASEPRGRARTVLKSLFRRVWPQRTTHL